MDVTVSLNDQQRDWLLAAVDNTGRIHGTPGNRRALNALTRVGLLTADAGTGWRYVTRHGHETAADIITGHAAAVIGRHIDGPDRIEQSKTAAADLHDAGYLIGGGDATADLIDRVTAVLACRHDQPTAERMAHALAAAHLLSGTWHQED
ncbi:hypothetical protein [Verrucosispora sp. WMMC514]|uniref:hypothetical protein n=1 Tax=Verrucosispora sp. WMMC514 TaxID=3015156 RepID=UPI00248C67EA|nr:hypothetical protein [Verrucosispora sp. WMMC514]WBB94140.1 hypothetical protein O7597_14925 [Verrucosispora sp. WMMC514]